VLDLQRDNDWLRRLVEDHLLASNPAALHSAGTAAKPASPPSKVPAEGPRIHAGHQAESKPAGPANYRRIVDDLAAELDAVAALLVHVE
jgi:hypothetical protein